MQLSPNKTGIDPRFRASLVTDTLCSESRQQIHVRPPSARTHSKMGTSEENILEEKKENKLDVWSNVEN